jgi:hypothetical protein
MISFFPYAADMKILAMEGIKITKNGLEETQNTKRNLQEQSFSLPETRKF